MKLNCFFVFKVKFIRSFIINALINWTFSFALGWKPSGPTNPKQSAFDKVGNVSPIRPLNLAFLCVQFSNICPDNLING